MREGSLIVVASTASVLSVKVTLLTYCVNLVTPDVKPGSRDNADWTPNWTLKNAVLGVSYNSQGSTFVSKSPTLYETVCESALKRSARPPKAPARVPPAPGAPVHMQLWPWRLLLEPFFHLPEALSSLEPSFVGGLGGLRTPGF